MPPRTLAEQMWLRDHPEDEPYWNAIDAACTRLAERDELHPDLFRGSDGLARIQLGPASSRLVRDDWSRHFPEHGPPVAVVTLLPDTRQLTLREDYIEAHGAVGGIGRRGRHETVPRLGMAAHLEGLPVIEGLARLR